MSLGVPGAQVEARLARDAAPTSLPSRPPAPAPAVAAESVAAEEGSRGSTVPAADVGVARPPVPLPVAEEAPPRVPPLAAVPPALGGSRLLIQESSWSLRTKSELSGGEQGGKQEQGRAVSSAVDSRLHCTCRRCLRRQQSRGARLTATSNPPRAHFQAAGMAEASLPGPPPAFWRMMCSSSTSVGPPPLP